MLRRRIALKCYFQIHAEALGAEAAGDLASWMDDMDANRGDIGELRHEMQLGFARIDARFERMEDRFGRIDEDLKRIHVQFGQVQPELVQLVESGQAKMQLLLEKGLREQTRFFFLAWAVLLASIIGLHAR
jgi:hypothetical protein